MFILIPLAFFIVSVLLLVVHMVDKAEMNNLDNDNYAPPQPETTIYHTWASLMPTED